MCIFVNFCVCVFWLFLPGHSQKLGCPPPPPKLLSQLKMQIKWPTGCSVSFQTGLKMYSLPFTRVLSVADSNTPVQYRIQPQCKTSRYVILHLWKIWQGAVPNDLDIQFDDHTRLGTRCKIPAIKRNSTTLSRSIYDHSFAVRGPKLWNDIPKNIKCAPSFEDFKSKLTSHFFFLILLKTLKLLSKY